MFLEQALQYLVVPILGAIVVLVRELPGRSFARELQRLAAVRDHLGPDEQASLDELIAEEVAVIKSRRLRRLSRKLDGSSVFALAVVLTFGGGVVGGLWAIPSLWARVPSVLVGVFVVMLAATGMSQLWKYPGDDEAAAQRKRERQDRRTARKSKRQSKRS